MDVAKSTFLAFAVPCWDRISYLLDSVCLYVCSECLEILLSFTRAMH